MSNWTAAFCQLLACKEGRKGGREAVPESAWMGTRGGGTGTERAQGKR